MYFLNFNHSLKKNYKFSKVVSCKWHGGIVVITTAQLHSSKSGLVGLNQALGVMEIHDGEYLRQWSRLEIRLNAFPQSTIPQKNFIIVIIIIIIVL